MGGKPNGARGGKPHVVTGRLDDAELEEFNAKRGDIPTASAIRMAIAAWAGPAKWGPNGERLTS